jgi:hypothetical protein
MQVSSIEMPTGGILLSLGKFWDSRREGKTLTSDYWPRCYWVCFDIVQALLCNPCTCAALPLVNFRTLTPKNENNKDMNRLSQPPSYNTYKQLDSHCDI